MEETPNPIVPDLAQTNRLLNIRINIQIPAIALALSIDPLYQRRETEPSPNANRGQSQRPRRSHRAKQPRHQNGPRRSVGMAQGDRSPVNV